MSLMPRWVLVCSVAVVLCGAVVGCDREPETKTLISWTDRGTGKVFTVTSRQLIADYVLELHVGGSGAGTTLFIDDKIYPNKLLLVREGEWLLVLNGPHVLAAYSYSTHKATNDGRAFPFTYRTTAGVVVAEKIIHSQQPPEGLRGAAVRKDTEVSAG